jgi:hypothetical protein
MYNWSKVSVLGLETFDKSLGLASRLLDKNQKVLVLPRDFLAQILVSPRDFFGKSLGLASRLFGKTWSRLETLSKVSRTRLVNCRLVCYFKFKISYSDLGILGCACLCI